MNVDIISLNRYLPLSIILLGLVNTRHLSRMVLNVVKGGMMILWDKALSGITPVNEIVHDRICAIRVQNVNCAVFNIFNVYMPAEGCADDLAVTLDELGAILDNSETNAYNIIGGDLNGDMGTLGGPRATRECTNEGRLVCDFARRYNLYPANLSMNAVGLSMDTTQSPVSTIS